MQSSLVDGRLEAELEDNWELNFMHHPDLFTYNPVVRIHLLLNKAEQLFKEQEITKAPD